MHICPDCGKSHERQGWAFYMLCIACARKVHAEQVARMSAKLA
jgi:deoxycytidylate deaminase